jgi:regulator of telomere elongation helicase 1
MEPKDSRTDIHKMFRDFDQEVCENPKGALLFAVCRGKVKHFQTKNLSTANFLQLSEGIDFADNHCRSVVIVGIPFPPLYDPKVMLKKAYLTEQCQIQLQRQMEERKRQQKGDKTEKKTNQTMIMVQNPDQWYKIEGTRAVNQALGRIIRHKDVSEIHLAFGQFHLLTLLIN